LKKSPTGPAFTKGPLQNKSANTSNNKGFTFIADNLMNRLVCLHWTCKTQRKENFSREARAAPLRTRPKLQPVQLRLSAMISHYFIDRGVQFQKCGEPEH
jgi:hypothetical protein